MKDVTRKRRSAVVSRWRGIICAVPMAGMIVLVLLYSFKQPLYRLASLPPWVVFMVAVVLGAMCSSHASGRWAAFFGVRHFHRYPPLWMAGSVGASLVVLLVGSNSAIHESLHFNADESAALNLVGQIAVVVNIFVGTCLGLIAHLRSRQSDEQGPNTADSAQATARPRPSKSFQGICAWLAKDDPITSRDDDEFALSRIARRIARRLQCREAPAQAVVGGLGSGKTSLMRLVEKELSLLAKRRVRLVAVPLWPYQTTNAAVEGIIRELVKTLGQDVGTAELVGLPASYVAAISSLGGVWTALAHLQSRATDPQETLERIDRVAKGIDNRYVVWIEDLERFASGRARADGPETAAEAERLNPIRALLHGLDQLDSISVVVATTRLQLGFDLEKIARHIEQLPLLPEDQAAEIIGAFRHGCRSEFDDIESASANARKALDALTDRMQREANRAVLGRGIHDLGDALIALCPTPRVLKQALRATRDAWTQLHGEIDFDDLLCMTILRTAEPDVFEPMSQHVDALRDAPSAHVSRERREEARKTWSTAFDELRLDSMTRKSVDRIIEFVFGQSNVDGKPQGIGRSQPVDYWVRFLATPELDDCERVQNVLRTIQTGDDNAILGLIENRERTLILEQFERFETEKLQRLFRLVVEKRSHESAASWESGDPPGFIPIWRMHLKRSRAGILSTEVVCDDVRAALDIAAPRSLYLAAKLEEYFVVPSGHMCLLGPQGDPNVEGTKSHLRRNVVSSYRGNAAQLVSSLTGAPFPTLLWICWGIDRVRANTTSGLPFPEWPDLAPTVLEAARLDPRVMLPQIACLVVSTSTEMSEMLEPIEKAEFNAAGAAELFGLADAVLDLFAGQDLSQFDDSPPSRRLIGTVVNYERR